MRPNIKSRAMYHDGLKSTTWIRTCASSSRFVRYFFKQYRLRWFRDTSFPLKRHTFKFKKSTHRRRCEWPRIRTTFVVPPRISTRHLCKTLSRQPSASGHKTNTIRNSRRAGGNTTGLAFRNKSGTKRLAV